MVQLLEATDHNREQGERRARLTPVLIVEDELRQLNLLVDIVEAEGFVATGCHTATEALDLVRREHFAIAIIDFRLPDLNGAQLLGQLRLLDDALRVIINTGYGSLSSAKDAVNLGAFAYVEKADDPDELARHLHRAQAAYLSQYTKTLETVVAERTAELHRSEERFRFIAETTSDSLYDWDIVTGQSWRNDAHARLLGLPPTKTGPFDWWVQHIHPEDRETVTAEFSAALNSQAYVWKQEYRLLRADGSWVYVLDQSKILRNSLGVPIRVVGALTDITDRRKMEDELRANEARFRALFEQVTVGMSHVRLDGRFLLVNQKLCSILGYTQEELLQFSYQELTHPDDLEAETRQLQRLRQGELREFSREKRAIRKDGSIVGIHITSSLIYDANDVPLYYVDIVEDISARKQLEETQSRLLAILEATSDLVVTTSVDGRVLYMNQATRELLGLAPGAEVSSWKVPFGYARGAEELIMKQALPFAVRNGSWLGEVVFVNVAGQEIPASQMIIAHKAADGTVEYFSTLARDIRAQKRAEEELQALPRQLLYVQENERRRIAHELHDEIGQVLTAIKINLQTIQRTPEMLAARMGESINLVENALQQVRTLSLDLRPPMLDDLGLVATLRWYLDQQAQRSTFSVHLMADLKTGRLSPEIEITCFRIVQEAVTNILRHARAQHIHVVVQQENDMLQLQIWNDGEPFDVEDARSRALHGRSVGITGMQERAQLMGGRVEITSHAEYGTEVRVWLPLERKGGLNGVSTHITGG